MSKNDLIKLIVDYLVSLTEETSLTLVGVMDRVCPQFRASVSDGELLAILSEVRSEVNKQGFVLDFSKYDDKEVGLPFVLEYVVRKA